MREREIGTLLFSVLCFYETLAYESFNGTNDDVNDLIYI